MVLGKMGYKQTPSFYLSYSGHCKNYCCTVPIESFPNPYQSEASCKSIAA